MFRHLITSINYKKLIEQQASQAAFGCDKQQSKKQTAVSPKAKGHSKVMKRTRLS